MGITLDDFKEGGPLRKYVTKIGLLDKIDNPNVDSEELLSMLNDSVTIIEKTKVAESDDEETPDEPVDPDQPVNPDQPVDPDEPVTPDDPDLPDPDDGHIEYTEIENAEDIPSQGTEDLSIKLGSTEAANSINDDRVFQNLAIENANISQNVTYNASEELTLNNVEISGSKQ